MRNLKKIKTTTDKQRWKCYSHFKRNGQRENNQETSALPGGKEVTEQVDQENIQNLEQAGIIQM